MQILPPVVRSAINSGFAALRSVVTHTADVVDFTTGMAVWNAGVGAAGSAAEQYRRHALSYDRDTAVFQWLRGRAVDRLGLRPGDVVVDVGCGTGLCFADIEARIGPHGHLIGVDASEAMLCRARRRVIEHRWDNITLVASPAEEADIPQPADAALFCATHDIVRTRSAVEHVVSHLRPGSRVVAAGGKFAPLWTGPLNAAVLAAHAPYVSSFDGFDQPWAHLVGLLDDLVVDQPLLGTGYLAVGRVPRRTADDTCGKASA